VGGETEAVQDGIHELAGCVSGEGTAGAVAAVGSGRESEDDHPGPRIAEAGNRLGPVNVIEIGAALLGSNALPVFDEAGTTHAADYIVVQEFEGSGMVHGCA
jgi:hypothetical protein